MSEIIWQTPLTFNKDTNAAVTHTFTLHAVSVQITYIHIKLAESEKSFYFKDSFKLFELSHELKRFVSFMDKFKIMSKELNSGHMNYIKCIHFLSKILQCYEFSGIFFSTLKIQQWFNFPISYSVV